MKNKKFIEPHRKPTPNQNSNSKKDTTLDTTSKSKKKSTGKNTGLAWAMPTASGNPGSKNQSIL
jgi:hypothetical protein